MSEPTAEFSPADAASARTAERWGRAVFVLAALWMLWSFTAGWNSTILDRHESRQAQTLLSAYWMKVEGPSLAYPLPVFGPPWSSPMEFPLYQGLVAAVSGATGASLETSARAVSVVAFVAMWPAVWGLLGLIGTGRAGRWIALATVLSAPVFLFYARTALIESTALALAAWFLWCFVRGLRGGGVRWWLPAALLGALAVTVKITTVLPCVAVAAWAVARTARRESWRAWLLPAALPAVAVAVAGLWWVRFGDDVKAANPLSAFLVSSNLREWNFGTWAQRTSSAFWNQLQFTTTHSVLVEAAGWLALVAVALADRRARRTAAGLVAAFFTGPLVFSNLYFIHDYYCFATAPFLTAAAGVLLAAAWERATLPLAARLMLVTGVLGAQLVEHHRGYGSQARHGGEPAPELATVVRAVVPADDVVVIGGWDWNPIFPYYAQRRAVMLRRAEWDLPAFAPMAEKLGRAKIRAVVWRGPDEPTPAMREWWMRELGILGAPAATDGVAKLYLRAADLPKLAAVRAGGGVAHTTWLLEGAGRPWDAELKEQPWTQDVEVGPATPTPFKARSFHGCGVYVVGGERRIIAHAVTELFLHPPKDAKRIRAEFRVLPEAYTREHPGDGVDVEIFEEVAPGARRRLFARHLEPAKNPEDRGDQAAELRDFGALTGDLVFAVTPGPAGRADFDWCDWKRIAVE